MFTCRFNEKDQVDMQVNEEQDPDGIYEGNTPPPPPPTNILPSAAMSTPCTIYTQIP